MVSLSLTISISSHPSPQITQPTAQLPNTHHSTPPSIHQSHPHSRPQSLCPSYANSLAPTYKSSLRPESLEHLLGSGSSFERRESGTGSGSRKRVSVVQIENGRLKRRILSTGMDGHGHESEGVRERKKSYGIGGAGNIRRPSDVIYPIRTNADGTRRRSSVWSSITTPTGTSPEGKKGGFWGLFRRGSVQEEGVKDDDAIDAVRE